MSTLDNLFNTLVSITEKRDAERNAFIKQVLLMSSSLFGFLIALHKSPIACGIARTMFALALVLLTLGILLLTISLYRQLHVYKRQFLQQKEEILKRMKNPAYNPQPILGSPNKLFSFSETLGYISLSLALISLTVYGILIA